MDSFSWLHLSDLHWGHAQARHYWGSTVEESFLDDLQRLISGEELRFDAVFFTGDLVQEGKAEHYRDLNGVLGCLKKVFDNNGLQPVWLAVPGNHDQVWRGAGDKALLDFQAAWDKQEHQVGRVLERAEIKAFIKKSFKDYSTWNRKNNIHFPLPAAGYTPGLLPGDFACTLQTAGGRKIGVVGLNTAFRQVTNRNYTGRLAVSVAQLTAVCGERPYLWQEEHDLCLLLSHHPEGWLTEESKKELAESIAPPGRFFFHLCGHMHECDYTEIRKQVFSEGRRTLQNYSLASQQEIKVYDDDGCERPKMNRQYGYLAGKIVFAPERAEVTVYPRKFIPGNRFNADSELCETDRNYFRFHLPYKQIVRADAAADNPQIKALVKAEMTKILKQPGMAKLSRYLADACREEAAVGSGSSQELADVLVDRSKLLEMLYCLHQAAGRCLAEFAEHGVAETDIKTFWESAVKILGWFLLLTVKDNWLQQVEPATIAPGAGIRITIPIKRNETVEIAFSAIKGTGAEIDPASGFKQLRYTRKIELGDEILGGDFSDSALRVREIKRILYKELVDRNFTGEFTEDDERELKHFLLRENQDKKHRYLVFKVSDLQNPLNNRQIYDMLVGDLENRLNLITIDHNQGESILVVGEPELAIEINRFFALRNPIQGTDK